MHILKYELTVRIKTHCPGCGAILLAEFMGAPRVNDNAIAIYYEIEKAVTALEAAVCKHCTAAIDRIRVLEEGTDGQLPNDPDHVP